MLMNPTQSIASIVASAPHQPVFAFRPQAITSAVEAFSRGLNATLLYAVKTNPDEMVLHQLKRDGVQGFEVSSLPEVELIHRLFPETTQYFMHPVKSRHAIAEAYNNYAVRHFALDSHDELQKILDETNNAKDLHLHLRVAVPNDHAELSLSHKFGVAEDEAATLLTEMAQHAQAVGVCFHVGSQCMNPKAYRIAIAQMAALISAVDCSVTYLNIGGGFPAKYPTMHPPAMTRYFTAIHEAVAQNDFLASMTLLAEPGRALVAESTSSIVRVELRKDDVLYINDGTYGSLFDAGMPGFVFPVRQASAQTPNTNGELKPYSFYGPTCDALDYMKGPFYLPADIAEGDYIEIAQLGAYATTLATSFNGFAVDKTLHAVSDAPLLSMYDTPSYMAEKE